MISFEDIRGSFKGRIEIGEQMARHVTFRIGGPADLYLEPVDKEDAVSLFRFLHDTGTRYVLIGNGSNVLVADEGIRDVVVNLESGFNHMRVNDGEIVAGAGVKLAKLVDFIIANGFGGAEMLAGIPGTLGGGIIMNAGAYGGEIADHLTRVEVIRNGRMVKLTKEEGGFGYRTSALTNDIVLEAAFRFPEGLAEPLKKRRRELLVKRNSAQPVNWPNAGSIFKNPPGDFAARLIEACGLKGRRVGGAQISDLHANFIINAEDATAEDVLQLIEIAQKEVHAAFDVKLELEIKPMGIAPERLERVGWGLGTGD